MGDCWNIESNISRYIPANALPLNMFPHTEKSVNLFPQTGVFVNVFLHTVDFILITPTHVETVVLLLTKE